MLPNTIKGMLFISSSLSMLFHQKLKELKYFLAKFVFQTEVNIFKLKKKHNSFYCSLFCFL